MTPSTVRAPGDLGYEVHRDGRVLALAPSGGAARTVDDLARLCDECGRVFWRRRTADGHLERSVKWQARRYCGRACSVRGTGRDRRTVPALRPLASDWAADGALADADLRKLAWQRWSRWHRSLDAVDAREVIDGWSADHHGVYTRSMAGGRLALREIGRRLRAREREVTALRTGVVPLSCASAEMANWWRRAEEACDY